MDSVFLFLFSRKGCCLCEGLEQKLRGIPINDLSPSIDFRVIDIDDEATPVFVRARYDLEVPVLAISSLDLKHFVELPRVPPRLNGDHLFTWLQKTYAKVLG